MPIKKEKDEFVVYVITLSNVKRYMSIEFIGGSCGYIIAQKALQSDLLGMIGSIIAPMAIRRVLQWQQLKSERHAWIFAHSLRSARRTLHDKRSGSLITAASLVIYANTVHHNGFD
ncbi:hypothetical protein [Paenibacillus lautus]|uniref:hypothetical protein n=1 Tax=Paenibacillus lautus TaxID=1401 RepID=UPI001FC93C89|nr:hypothetical protein [Paenibacillus lautus]